MAGATGQPHGAVPPHRRPTGGVQVAPHRRRSGLRLRDWRIRTKLGAVLVIPSLAFALLAGFQARTLFTQADTLDAFAGQVAVADPIGGLVHAVSQERDRWAGELAAPPGLTGRPDPARLAAVMRPYEEAVDAAATRFRAAAGPTLRGDVSWQVAYGRTVELIDQLPTLRTAATSTAGAATVFDTYTRLVDALLTLLAEPSPGPDRPELSEAVLRTVQLARVKELGSRVRARIFAASVARAYGPDDLVTLSDLRTQQLSALAEFRLAATRDQMRLYDEVSVSPPFVEATRLEEQTISGTTPAPTVLDPEQWWAASQRRADAMRTVEERVAADAAALASSRSGAQLRESLLVAGGILLVLAFAVVASIVVGRSIAKSLRTLRAHALQVAQVQLPDALDRLRVVGGAVPRIDVWPPPVRSLDEIGQVAEAFVAVHSSAVTVAVEQATMRRTVNAMFVNLARRSQVLVERQLELLDELEREEGDPDQLDNLFKLDHLAARMRRNDDSLLVLAGIESPRRWSGPVALPAIVLAAVAEIEFYPRVRHDAIDPVHVVGHAVADLVHILAELLENATVFSPPSTTVQVFAHGGPRVGTVVEIADDGLGMSPSSLRDANDLLAAPPTADVAASERMGLFVVSHLAARHGIRVELRAARSGGVIAVVRLPADLLANDQHPLPYQPSRPMLAAVAAVSGAPPSLQPGPRAGSPPPPPRTGVLPAVAAPPLPPGTGVVPAVAAPPVPPGTGVRPAVAAPPVPPGYGVVPAAPPIPAQLSLAPPPRLPPPTAPASGVPVSGLPVSGVPVSAAPVVPGGPVRGGQLTGDAGAPPAGRRPGRTTVPRRGKLTAGEPVSWFSRSAAPAAVPAPTAGPPAVPVTGGVSSAGLPKRVPMAQLPNTDATTPPAPPQRPDVDPDAVSSILNRFYGGVRRAETEDTTDLSSAPEGRGEREQR